jgi:hypothetical protein
MNTGLIQSKMSTGLIQSKKSTSNNRYSIIRKTYKFYLDEYSIILLYKIVMLSCTHILKCMSSKHSSNPSYANHTGKKINAANNLPGKKRWHFYLYYHVTRENKATIFHEARKIHNMFTNQTCDGPSKGKMHLRNTKKRTTLPWELAAQTQEDCCRHKKLHKK